MVWSPCSPGRSSQNYDLWSDKTIQIWPKSNPLQLYSGCDKLIQGVIWQRECLKNYGWRFVTLYKIWWAKPSPRGEKCKKTKWLSKEALQIAEKRREVNGKGEKERYTHLNREFQRIARREKTDFLSDQGKEIEENSRMGKTRDLFKQLRNTKGIFHAKMGSIKDRNCTDLIEAEGIKKNWQE